MLQKAAFFLLAVALLAGSPSVRADEGGGGVYNVVIQKQDTKKATGWNLSDWLATRDKMRLMDLWLALHSPSPYEFFVDGNYALSNSGNSGVWGMQAAAYASIFGLQGEDELDAQSRSSVSGIFDFRIFGLYAQSTNITLQAGLRSLNESGSSYRDALAGVDVTIYLARFFGIEGLYRHYFNTISTTSGSTISEERYSAGAFLDFSILRVYGEYQWQPATYATAFSSTNVSRNGPLVGLRLFF